MIDDENYNQTKRVRDEVKRWLEFDDITDKQRESWELSVAIADAMLELQALPEDAPEEERHAKITVIAGLQQKGLESGLLIPGPSERSK